MNVELEKDKLPAPEDWINDSLFTHQLYPQKNYLTVHAYLHHLINLAEMREIVQEQPIDAVILRKLRDGANVFVTMGKTTASHIPLPRSEFKKENFTYQIGENLFKCKTIVPAIHNSPNFIANNSNLLPVSDFRDELVITETTEKGLQTRVIETDLKTPTSIARKVSEQPLEIVYEHTFGETENGEPWAVRIFSDTTKSEVFWIETMVDTSEYGEGRANTTPFLTRIKANTGDIQSLIFQLQGSFDKPKSEFDKRKIIYYLTSVVYFQSEINRPYLPETIVPSYMNPSLPNIYNILIRKPLADIPSLISQCVNEKDGVLALNRLAELSGGTNSDFNDIQTKLKLLFQDQYLALSDLLKKGINNLSEEVQKNTASEISQTSEISSRFMDEWNLQKNTIIKTIGEAFNIKILTDDDQNYERVARLCDLESQLEKTLDQLSSDDEIDVVMRGIISELLVTAFITFIHETVQNDGVYNSGKHLKLFKGIWINIRKIYQDIYGMNPENIDRAVIGAFESGISWERRFPDAIEQIANQRL